MTVPNPESLKEKLSQFIITELLEIDDESSLHAGHSGARPEGGTHFRILIVAKSFENMNRIQRHKTIYTILSDELHSNIHALALETLTPLEYAARYKPL
jgi:BolA protein